jgi:hypothetical protein
MSKLVGTALQVTNFIGLGFSTLAPALDFDQPISTHATPVQSEESGIKLAKISSAFFQPSQKETLKNNMLSLIPKEKSEESNPPRGIGITTLHS